MTQTAVEWLIEQIKKEHPFWTSIFEQAKEMEKQQIIDAAERWKGTDFAEKYYAETYGSKGSDEHPEDNLVEIPTSSQTEISDESWEGCDGCTEQDEIMYKNGYVKGYNAAIAELPKEISDEEIENYAKQNAFQYYEFISGAKWYREQLKSKQ